MIGKVTKTKQYLAKILLGIIQATILWAIALYLQPLKIVVAEPAIDVENIDSAVAVEDINVQGYTIFSDKEIEKIIQLYRGKKLNFNQLRNISEAITELYTSRGYITSGAFLPEQEIVNGVVNVQVVEGKLEAINIEGLKYLQENYIRSFISSAPKSEANLEDISLNQLSPLNINSLEAELQSIQRDPSVANIQAELIKGTEPNQSVLLIEIEETSPFEAKLSFDNYRSPSVGELQGTLETGYRNIIGISDRAFAEYNLTEGFNSYSLGYEIPISYKNGIVNFEYRNGDSKIIEDSFEEVNIRAEADTFSLGYRQPIIYRSQREVALGLAFERQNSETFILEDRSFSFRDGSKDGRSVVSVLSMTADWIERFSSTIFSISSELNFGLDLFEATVKDDAPDGLFFSWLGQAQWIEALNQDRDLLLVTRLATQLSPNSLLPLEQFTLGGIGTVRGYRQNQEVGDNAFVGTVEIYLPLVGDRISDNKLNLIPFFDGGTVWDNNSDRAEALASLGIEFNWQFRDFLFLRIDYGVPLINERDRGDSLQNNGLSFSLQFQPF
ncbi:MAG: ShlB/FhaC/HecB family hemolysin secretion/activation protein [Pleurocapsa sp. MO_226.B13]|nr:ShlB/FhaC/HecB family hemolysin secretion/activation protein [Pleurocapsa sp. MO_226.B13]